jgi:hypothetical protein
MLVAHLVKSPLSFMDSELYYCIHQGAPLVSVLSQLNPILAILVFLYELHPQQLQNTHAYSADQTSGVLRSES